MGFLYENKYICHLRILIFIVSPYDVIYNYVQYSLTVYATSSLRHSRINISLGYFFFVEFVEFPLSRHESPIAQNYHK